MQTFTLVGLLVVGTAMFLQAPQPASAVCCGTIQQLVSHWVDNIAIKGVKVGIRQNVCNDCTRGTPYCGHGPCNIFGCNCDGGCREGECERVRSPTPDGVVEVIDPCTNASTIIAAGDSDSDHAITLAEAQTVLNEHCGVVADLAQLQALDTNNDGKLTEDEIDPPTPSPA